MKTMLIIASKNGKVSITTRGCESMDCNDATRAIQKSLGVVTSDRVIPDHSTTTHVQEVQQ
jgi:hypothetical protein